MTAGKMYLQLGADKFCVGYTRNLTGFLHFAHTRASGDNATADKYSGTPNILQELCLRLSSVHRLTCLKRKKSYLGNVFMAQCLPNSGDCRTQTDTIHSPQSPALLLATPSCVLMNMYQSVFAQEVGRRSFHIPALYFGLNGTHSHVSALICPRAPSLFPGN